MTDIRVCNCVHQFQDRVYGSKKRVHNNCHKGWRCTVCGDVKQISNLTIPSK